jgi:hypothetical protein
MGIPLEAHVMKSNYSCVGKTEPKGQKACCENIQTSQQRLSDNKNDDDYDYDNAVLYQRVLSHTQHESVSNSFRTESITKSTKTINNR